VWADGFNGIYEHLADRAAFVLATPNTPQVQARNHMSLAKLLPAWLSAARAKGWR
jgi:hypothetical protein